MTGIDREAEPRQDVGNPPRAYDEMEGAQRGLVELSGKWNPTTATWNQPRQVGYEDEAQRRSIGANDDAQDPTKIGRMQWRRVGHNDGA